MRKIVLILLTISLLVNIGFAKINLDKEIDKLFVNKTHFTFGLGFYSGNPFLGAVTKNGYGYPKNEVGFSNLAGISYTWIIGVPLEEEIEDAINEVKERYGEENIRSYELSNLVRTEINKNTLNYFTIGTIMLIIPFNLEYGWMWLSGDNVRFRFGLGLPLLIAFGINFDF